MSRNVGIVLLVLAGVSVGIGFLCFLGFIGLESEYSSSCQGFTGALVQADDDGQQACEDLGALVFFVGLFAAIFGIFGSPTAYPYIYFKKLNKKYLQYCRKTSNFPFFALNKTLDKIGKVFFFSTTPWTKFKDLSRISLLTTNCI